MYYLHLLTKTPCRADKGTKAIAASLWVTLVVANLIDYIATLHALSYECSELNPFILLISKHAGFEAVLVVKALFLLVLLTLLRYITGWKLALLAIATTFYLVLTVYHAYGTYTLLMT